MSWKNRQRILRLRIRLSLSGREMTVSDMKKMIVSLQGLQVPGLPVRPLHLILDWDAASWDVCWIMTHDVTEAVNRGWTEAVYTAMHLDVGLAIGRADELG